MRVFRTRKRARRPHSVDQSDIGHNRETKSLKWPIGKTAYLDGRDGLATPPITVENVNLFVGVENRRIACQLKHGTKVLITDRAYTSPKNGGRPMYFVLTKDRTLGGWVLGCFLHGRKTAPIGDLVK